VARTVICYEIIFPEEINPNNNDIDAIINLTNDAWFGNSSGPYQHLNSARFRAIEQGVPVLRAANTGISAVIDPYGRVIRKINLNKSGYIVSSLPNKTKKTLYSKVGDFLFFGVLMLSVLVLLLIKMNRKNERI
ncbi:MAG: nitrilase-related carbon-nitrogen hydrolase, partial [Alphaproteobacteria bacterium]